MPTQRLYSFEKLEVWNDCRAFTLSIYTATKYFPKNELFGLTNQMCRAAVSIGSNITEGTSRRTEKDKCRFLEISYGSLMEVYSQLYIAKDLKYISEDIFSELKAEIHKISNKINALKRSYTTPLNA